MSSKPSILVIGATGAIGKPITHQLILARSHFSRIAILTSASTIATKADEVAAVKAQGVDVLAGDLTSEADVKAAYAGIDTVISCVGRNAILLQKDLIKWADECGSVKLFYPSEYGTDIEFNSTSSPREKPHQLKLQVRAYIKELLARGSNVQFIYLVTGPYSDMYMGKSRVDEIGTFDVGRRKAVVIGEGKERISFTAMADVGKLLVASLTHPPLPPPGGPNPQILLVNSFTCTPDEIVAEYERQTGGQKWEVVRTPAAEVKKLEESMWAQGHPAATPLTLRRIWMEGGTLYEDDQRGNRALGSPRMETLGEQVRQCVEVQKQAGA